MQRWRHRIAVVGLGLAWLAGCEALEPTICTTEARPALVVEVVDARTGEGVADALVVAHSDAHLDSARTAEQLRSVPLAYERAGVYEVTVTRDGYRPWTRTGVRVDEDECHVVTRELVARLEEL